MKEKQFYKGDVAHLIISNEGGKECLVEVRIIAVLMEYGHTRYLVEPVSGIGQIKVEHLVFKDK